MKKESKLDESLGMRTGKESTKKQPYKARRDESKGLSHKKAKDLVKKIVKKAC